MQNRSMAARESLATLLGRRPMSSAAELAAAVGTSVPTVHRWLDELGDRVVAGGKARRARYALRRALRGDAADLPLYEVDEAGRATLRSRLALTAPAGTWMPFEGAGWPLIEEARDGWWPGLPYPLHDMRPQGYLGRQLARAEHRVLAVAPDPEEWSDDDVLFVLSRSGWDTSGNLILGDAACELWLESKSSVADPLAGMQVGPAYARLAEQAIAAGVPGSSVGGEFPKFGAMRDLPGAVTPHVLVKFSGADDSAAVRRWADLLAAEHLALECAATLPGVRSARSRLIVHKGRSFLEVERFDRVGLFGRSRLCGLDTLNAALIGEGTMDWPRLASRLAQAGWLSAEDETRVRHLWWFGRLIANTDMHLGNLSFRPEGMLQLAPTYDMLPMLYAPLPGGEVPVRPFQPALPLPDQREIWATACRAAIAFWTRVTGERRISAGFRSVAQANAQLLADNAARA